MLPAVIWHRVVAGLSAAAIPPFLDALKTAGLRTIARTDDLIDITGLLFFHDCTADVAQQLRELSLGGAQRILAVGLAPVALDGGRAWSLLQHGAADVLVNHPGRDLVAEVAARITRWLEIDRIVESPFVRENLIGRSRVWIATLRGLIEAARYTDGPLLLLGETGTGKELAARLAHSLDARRSPRAPVVVDCGTLSKELAGSEFFGHERGSFTGAMAARDGAFQLADGGTLFLDEIGELPTSLQVELLRVVQEQTYKRLGSNTWRQTRFRLISATNRDLSSDEYAASFRRDLYYRIASVTVRLPPLRERPEDILPLVAHFTAALGPGGEPIALDDTVRDYLIARPYPGNIRELRQLVGRLVHRHVGTGPITPGDIPEDERPSGAPTDFLDWRDAAFERSIHRAVAQGAGLRQIGTAATETAIRVALAAEGSLRDAARRLGVTDRALQMRRAQKQRYGDRDQPGDASAGD